LLEKESKTVTKPFQKTIAAILLTVVGAWLAAAPAAAESPKPALTIAFAGYERLTHDLKAIDQIDSRLGLASKLDDFLNKAASGVLDGLDKSRPWGVMVYIGESDEPTALGYLPVTDLKKLIAAIPVPGGETPTANDKGIYKIPSGPRTIYAKQKGEWAVLADDEGALADAAADPSPLISDLAKKYLVAVRGNVQNVPAVRRDQFLGALRGMVQIAMSAQGVNEEQQANIKQAFDQLDKLSKELKSLVIGLGFDHEAKSIFLDVETRAVEGSELAAKTSLMKEAKTNFAGFVLPGAALTMLAAGSTDDADVAQAQQMLKGAKAAIVKQLDDNDELGDKRRDLAKQLLNDVFDVLKKTVALKKSDAGLAVVLADQPAVVGGWMIAGGKKLDAALRKLAKAVEDENAELGQMIKLDAEEHEGVKFHVATIPVPPTGGASEVFGDHVQIVIGVSDSRLYIGAGKEPIATIKKAIEASKEDPDKSVPPMELVISAAPIAKFAAKTAPNETLKKKAKKFADQIAKLSGKDRLTMTVKPIDDGALMRLTLEPGALKTILGLYYLQGPGGDEEGSDEN
jgi:hypothetical protein